MSKEFGIIQRGGRGRVLGMGWADGRCRITEVQGGGGQPGTISVEGVVMVFISVFHVYSTVILVDSPTSPSLGHLLPASPRGNLSPAPKPEAGSEGPGGALAPGQAALLLHHSVNLISK